MKCMPMQVIVKININQSVIKTYLWAKILAHITFHVSTFIMELAKLLTFLNACGLIKNKIIFYSMLIKHKYITTSLWGKVSVCMCVYIYI